MAKPRITWLLYYSMLLSCFAVFSILTYPNANCALFFYCRSSCWCCCCCCRRSRCFYSCCFLILFRLFRSYCSTDGIFLWICRAINTLNVCFFLAHVDKFAIKLKYRSELNTTKIFITLQKNALAFRIEKHACIS